MKDPGSTGTLTKGSEQSRGCQKFLLALFRALDRNQVRYCVLHSWDELPERLSSDLDLAVHPEDKRKLGLVYWFLREQNYIPVQVIHYFVDAHCFRFLWFEGPAVCSVSVDIIFGHQRGALVVPSIEELVSSRRRHGMFWVPSPEEEFSYLLAKKAWKGEASTKQVLRLKTLVQELGRPTAEKLVGRLFLGSMNVRVVELCASGRVNEILPELKMQSWKASLMRSPLRLTVNVFSEAKRLIRRWLHVTGLFVVVLGPDGVGKSTLIRHLIPSVGPAFKCDRIFHWRPMLLWRRKRTLSSTQPHSHPPHNAWWSSARLIAHVLDYWSGYWLLIRPLLARAGLVLFDRYFDDVLIDPKRYRYGGPLWLARMLRPLIPQPDLILVLDAMEEAVLSRKQELAQGELLRQRKLYAQCVTESSGTRILDATGPVVKVTAEASAAIIAFLSQRFERQHADWLGYRS